MLLPAFLRIISAIACRTRWLGPAVGLLLGLLLGLLPGSCPALAQPLSTDSLRQALRAAPTDTARAKTALRLSAALAATDTARARYYARQALILSQQIGYGYGQAHGWLQLSALALIGQHYQRAAEYGHRAQAVALPLFRQTAASRLRRLLAGIANNQGSAADQQGHYEAATRHYLQAAAYLSSAADTPTLLTVYANLGNSFQALSQPREAARYWQRAVALGTRTRRPVPGLLLAYLQLAALHLQQARPDSAAGLLAAARPLLPIAPLYAGEFYGTLGQYYLHQHQPEAARQALQQAWPYARQKGNPAYQAQLLLHLGQVEGQVGRVAQARNLLRQSLALAATLREPAPLLRTLEALVRLEEATGQWQDALGYYRRRQHLQDSLTTGTVRAQINQLETRFRTRQQAQLLRQMRRERTTQQRLLHQQRRLNVIYLVVVGLLTAAALLGGMVLRHHRRLARQQQQLQQQRIRQLEQEQELLLARAVLQGQEEERRRLARELHDGLGGMLSTVKLYLATVQGRLTLPLEEGALFNQSIAHLDSSITELRQVARNLMPEVLLTFGLSQALQDLCASVRRASKLEVALLIHGLEGQPLDHATETTLYRMVQELLNNCIRHAQAQQVLVQLMRHGPLVHLVVEDDGQGFAVAAGQRGVGLRSLQARTDYVRGTLLVESVPGQGTTVSIEVPLSVLEPA